MTTLTTLTINNGINRAFYSDGGSLIISPNDAKNLSRVYNVRIENETTKYRRTDTTELSRDETDFNIKDEKGRAIGFVITVLSATWEVCPDATFYYTYNPAFIARTSVTRDGVPFGATTNSVKGNTENEVMKKAVTRRANALKRYTKKFEETPVDVPVAGHEFGLSMSRRESIKGALDECFVGGHVSHITNPANGRIVAVRPWYLDRDRDDDAFTLTFSDPKVDLRKTGDELIAHSWDEAIRLIYTFMIGDRCNEKQGYYESHINQADREVDIVKLTPTRARISYWLPKSGDTFAWRQRTTVGGYHYLRSV